jgi:hypothetical protein
MRRTLGPFEEDVGAEVGFVRDDFAGLRLFAVKGVLLVDESGTSRRAVHRDELRCIGY